MNGCAEWEAVALYDYVARSAAELSFKQGDHVLLHSKASADWWKGEVGGVKGLIPHKYIRVPEGWEFFSKYVFTRLDLIDIYRQSFKSWSQNNPEHI